MAALEMNGFLSISLCSGSQFIYGYFKMEASEGTIQDKYSERLHKTHCERETICFPDSGRSVYYADCAEFTACEDFHKMYEGMFCLQKKNTSHFLDLI